MQKMHDTALSSSRNFTAGISTLVFLTKTRLPKHRRAGPSASLDKSCRIKAIELSARVYHSGIFKSNFYFLWDMKKGTHVTFGLIPFKKHYTEENRSPLKTKSDKRHNLSDFCLS